MECKCSVSAGNEDDTPWAELTMNSNHPEIVKERLCRIGISIPPHVTDEQLLQSKKIMNKIVKAFEACNSPNTVSQHFSNNPRPYPTPVDMHPDSIQQHVMHGRRAETSMLMYDVKQCTCCGSVKPGHNDPGFPNKGVAPFERMHLVNSWHPAYLCTCSTVCRGSQFYAKDKPSLMTYYTHTHAGMKANDTHNSHVSDAVLCMKCYDEVSYTNKDGKKYDYQPLHLFILVCAVSHPFSSYPNTDLKHGFALSARNGFGPCHTPSLQLDGEDLNIAYSRELYYLCCSLTPVEEAAIRPITPLITIIKLNNGGIGSKGNTSCVWQQSKLNMILPNLPSQCNYIIVTRANTNSNSGMSSTRFKRAKIHRVIELLQLTQHKAWKDYVLSEPNLLAWPEEGDIATNFPDMVITESENGHIIDSDGTVLGDLNVNIDGAGLYDDTGAIHDGQEIAIVNDFGGENTGPAPLQNDVIPDETFEGVVNVVDQTETGGGNANMINTHVCDLVHDCVPTCLLKMCITKHWNQTTLSLNLCCINLHSLILNCINLHSLILYCIHIHILNLC
jgi:hypothetical protein